MTTITQFKNRFAKKPNLIQTGLDPANFRQIVTAWNHEVNDKKDNAGVFSLCEFNPNYNSRKESNITSVTGIVLDVDGGNSPVQVLDALYKLEPYAHLWYTTYSHAADAPKVRIIVPIETAVTPAEFKKQALALRLAAMLGLTVDECSAKPTQVFYLPTKATADADCEISVGDSTTLFDVSWLPAKPAKPSKKSSGNSDDDQLGIFKTIAGLVASMFDGIEPLYVGDKFHVYIEGAWRATDPGRTFSKMLIEFHDRKVGIAEVMEWVGAMKTMFSCDKFPGAATSKITLTNGTLNTDTGELEPHDPENYHRTGMAFDFDPSARCDLWLKTLDEIFFYDPDKEQKIMQLQEWFGYCLTPNTIYHVMLWLYGSGENGKSVITHILRYLLGEENCSAIPLSLLSGTFNGAELDGKLANIVDEIATKALMQEDELKKIVSGDPIMVQRKREHPYFFSPTARITAATNTLPQSQDSTHGLDRRVMLLTFNRRFTQEEIDRELGTKLKAELPGIFVWALVGHMRLKAQDKFTEPPSGVAAKEEFIACRNSASLFRRDCLELPGDGLTLVGGSNGASRTPSHALYETYKTYCSTGNHRPFSKESFGKKLKELGVEQIRTGGKRYYLARVVNLEEHGIGEARYSGPTRATMSDVCNDLPDAA